MAQDPSTDILDHIVHLSPPGSLQSTVETWQKLGFNVTPGGTHADGLTENALVAFKDGTYIELISFTHPLSDYPLNSPSRHARESHPWAKKEAGFIDFAFLGNDGDPSIAGIINRRAAESKEGVKLRYANELRGGRTRVDGEKLEWLITAPEQDPVEELVEEEPVFSKGAGDVRGRLPFFCGDLTPRRLRVPHESGEITHSNHAIGIDYVRLLTSREDLPALFDQFAIVTGSPSTTTNLDSNPDSRVLHLHSPTSDSSSQRVIELRISTPTGDGEISWLQTRGAGIYELGIRGEGSQESFTPFVKLVWVDGIDIHEV
ncbi:unnamed protein product [Somion occarium]|uniref:Glyoxalase-like domain-containing protein n=1 Tax=Somion occarium TaxID=3059160 RepID=A0ABP1D9N3_9APHY